MPSRKDPAPSAPHQHGRFFYSKAKDCRRCSLASLCLSPGRWNKAIVTAAIRQVFVQPTQDKARGLWRAFAAFAHNSLPKLAQAMEEAEDDVLAYPTFPAAHRINLHSTNT